MQREHVNFPMTISKPLPSTTPYPESGLCASCVYLRIIQSDRRSVFIMCDLSKTRSEFQKYPFLPVLRCRGYSLGSDGGDDK